MERRPRVALIFTGGTIDSVGVDRLDMAWYIEAGKRLADGELVARVPELASIADVEEIPFRRLPSQSIKDRDLLDLVALIHRLFDEDRADGVVITHGTNTLEETAYFLHLTIKRDRPVVIVGAMRPSSAISADGPLNLLNGVRVAAAPEARGLGVLVVLNETIHSARDVTKTATYRVDTFQGRDLGPLGYADNDGRVLIYHRPARPHTTATEFDVSGDRGAAARRRRRVVPRRRRGDDRRGRRRGRPGHRQRRDGRRSAHARRGGRPSSGRAPPGRSSSRAPASDRAGRSAAPACAARAGPQRTTSSRGRHGSSSRWR